MPPVELPVLADVATCPAALPIAGACRSQQGVICREMEIDAEGDAGHRMTPRALEVIRESEGGKYLNVKSDPSTVTGFCHGNALPVVTNDDGQGRASYTYCPTWQAARDRHLAGLDGLYDEQEPEPVSMGVEADPLEDPWTRARRDLDDLAPPAPGEANGRQEVDVDALVAEAMRQ